MMLEHTINYVPVQSPAYGYILGIVLLAITAIVILAALQYYNDN